MKWWLTAWQLIRDVLFTGLGAWIIYRQVYAAAPSPYLLLFAAACFWPAARSAVTTLLSGPGSPSELPRPPAEPSSGSSPHEGGTGERG